MSERFWQNKVCAGSQADQVPIATPPDTTEKQMETERDIGKDMLASRHQYRASLNDPHNGVRNLDREREWMCVCEREIVKANVFL